MEPIRLPPPSSGQKINENEFILIYHSGKKDEYFITDKKSLEANAGKLGSVGSTLYFEYFKPLNY